MSCHVVKVEIDFFFSSSDGLSLLSVEAYRCYVYAEVTRACLTGPNVGCGCSIRAEKTERLFSSLKKGVILASRTFEISILDVGKYVHFSCPYA